MAFTPMTAEMLTIKGQGGDEIEAYLAQPKGGGPFPGVVVIHHGPGWDEWTGEVVAKLALHGYLTISPHLYHRFGPGSPDDGRRDSVLPAAHQMTRSRATYRPP